ncbi:MAG: HlyD family efflux transporter periplasmic adaptor subunit [Pseudohongiellaceae bacterium]|nr:HlyD family efflux transporter periplasmic adaptor subunit [Pseudohongiellaceae bacterium]
MSTNQQSAAAPEGDSRLKRLAILVELERRFRNAETTKSLAYLLVNDTHSLAPYRQAALWQASEIGTGSLVAVSGLVDADANAPYSSWVSAVCNWAASREQNEACTLTARDIPEELAQDWQQWLPETVVWLPIVSSSGSFKGGLLLAREMHWSSGELKLLQYLGEAWLHSHEALVNVSKPLFRLSLRSKKVWLAAAALVLIVLCIPVHQTALVPAEVIALDPVLIRAPVDGVIEKIDVLPNQRISAGETILTLDATRLNNRLEVALKALEVADAEYRQVAQQGLFDSRANAELSMLKGRAEQHEAEVNYLRDMLERIEIKAPRDGIVIFDDVNDWIGRPVAVGERIMSVANPESTELELRVPVADAIALESGARVRLFLNTSPHKPLDATLHYASYQASLTPDGIMAYRLLANFEGQVNPPRIGLKGTAKVYGGRTLLIAAILRRPLTTLRQMLGI